MKRVLVSTLFLLLVTASFGQSPFQVGLYTEGGLFFPSEISSESPSLKQGFMAGGGLYIASPVVEKFAVSAGVGYRYKENHQQYSNRLLWYPPIGGNPYGYSPYGYGSTAEAEPFDGLVHSWILFQQHYVVVPLRLKYVVWRQLFVEPGIDAAWLLNYDYIREELELDWTIGVGWELGRLKCSLNYRHGFKDQGMGDIDGYEEELGQAYRNHLLAMNLSYPLWRKKSK
jgi:hypothetical protein